VFLCARAATSDDVEIMLSLYRGLTPEERDRERTLWRRLWGRALFQGIVMEDLTHEGEPRAVGMLIAAFLLPELHDKLVRPGAPRLIEGLAEALKDVDGPVPTEEELGQANAGEGVDAILCWLAYDEEGVSPHLRNSQRSRVVSAFLDVFQGNRVRRITTETSDETVLTRFKSYGYQTIRDEGGREVLSMHRDQALGSNDLTSQRLFSYDPPVLGFNASQRAILLLARHGFTDQEVSACLGKSPDSVKKRWTGIYARFEQVFPGRLPSAGEGSRGMEKRRTLLAYLRDRPEELQPYRKLEE
jgi:DNA-binding CsgD family transcriptional regulator